MSLILHCNGVEVLNVVLSHLTCSSSGWRTSWSRDVNLINFHESDTTSVMYRAALDLPGTFLLEEMPFDILLIVRNNYKAFVSCLNNSSGTQ